MQIIDFKGLFRISGLLALLILGACSSESIDNDSPPDKQYEAGERLLKQGRYLEAVERFRILRTRYPYSKEAAAASLRIGDTHFEEESFAEAAAAYKLFRELYPKHPQSAYALFQIGESNYNQVPETVDRDLSAATDGINAFEEFLARFPQDPKAEDARKKLLALKEKLAEKEDYIGDFYFKRGHYRAAANRYQGLLDRFGGFGPEERALYRLAYSYEKFGDATRAEEIADRYANLFPQGQFISDIKQIKEKIAKDLQ
jgi:outer membrane protein assembly factor BamD